jgi:hypothetical protein
MNRDAREDIEATRSAVKCLIRLVEDAARIRVELSVVSEYTYGIRNMMQLTPGKMGLNHFELGAWALPSTAAVRMSKSDLMTAGSLL